jgi:hypothetical protein
MKKVLKVVLIILGILVAVGGTYLYFSSKRSPAATSNFDQNGISVQVDYCKPFKKSRTIFAPKADGVLQPYGEVWRTGANSATIFEVKQDVKIGDKALKAGKYTLWTIPNEPNWTIIFNGETGQWGTNYDESKDVLRVDVPSGKTPDVTEQFTITFASTATGAEMILKWDTTEVKVPINK